ncbi:MAG: hypothetical protein OEM96_07170 [Gemmatimonadota bacterium]|nr:hypothetical protein [Gemmatimonadota bacterium]
MSPRIILGPSDLVPSDQKAMLLAIACSLLLLSIKTDPRPDQIRNQV